MARFRWQEAGSVVAAGTARDEILAALLARRGYQQATAVASFLNPTPAALGDLSLLADLDRAVARLRLAHERQEQIVLWGDYDVDGLTSVALLYRALRGMGFAVQPHIPHRVRDGYGLNSAGLAEYAALGVTLAIAVDCGISNSAEIAAARPAGLDVIVIDHHALPPRLPEAAAVVNPRRLDCAYPYKDLAAVGLAYMLVRGLVAAGFALRGAWDADEPDLLELLEYVALGTVADVAPLTGENRILVAWGLDALRHTSHPGIQALCAVAGVDQARITTWEIGHALAPRLNAAGRIADPVAALKLLLAETPEEALPLAHDLQQLNRERQRVMARVLEEATARLEDDGLLAATLPILQLDGVGWTAGVVGLVAGRLAEQYGRPAIVLERGEQFSKGSARSVDGFNLVEALAECHDLLDHYGGHAKAAGLTVANDKLVALRERLLALAGERLTSDDPRPALAIDLDMALSDLTWSLADTFERLAPFGHGNPEPLLLLRGITTRWPRPTSDGRHLLFRASGQHGSGARTALRCVAFYQGERSGELTAGGRVDLVGTLRREWWQGEERLSFHVRDFRAT